MIKKISIFILVILWFFVVLLVAFTFVNKSRFLTPILIPKPTPTPTLTPLPIEVFVSSPSAYATDEAVLKIEKDLVSLEKDLDTVDLEELPLRPPVLDLKVEY